MVLNPISVQCDPLIIVSEKDLRNRVHAHKNCTKIPKPYSDPLIEPFKRTLKGTLFYLRMPL